MTVSASVGVAFLPSDALDDLPSAEALLRSADEAMYRAKRSGPGQYRLVDVTAPLAGSSTLLEGAVARDAPDDILPRQHVRS